MHRIGLLPVIRVTPTYKLTDRPAKPTYLGKRKKRPSGFADVLAVIMKKVR